MKSIGKTIDEFNMDDFSPFILSIAHSILMCFVMSHLFSEVMVDTWQEGIKYSFIIWIAFFASTYSTHLVFGQLPFVLTLIDNGKELVSFLIAGIILGS